MAVLNLYTGITPEEMLRLCDEGFDENKYHDAKGIRPPIKEMEDGATPSDIVRHWLAYWSLLAVLCDEGSTAPTGLPWLAVCMVGPCIRDGLVQLPDTFKTQADGQLSPPM
jgi:hypothetical protein